MKCGCCGSCIDEDENYIYDANLDCYFCEICLNRGT
jgi:hypothetical protein